MAISAKALFISVAAVGLVSAGAITYVGFDHGGQTSGHNNKDAIAESARIVGENMSKPCAAEKAKKSVLLLTEPGMTCP